MPHLARHAGAGSCHCRKHSTFGLHCGIVEPDGDYGCQLGRQMLICISLRDRDLFHDFEISPSKQIKLIKTSAYFWHCTLTPHYLSRTLRIGRYHRSLNHKLHREAEGEGRGWCLRQHQAAHCLRLPSYNSLARGRKENACTHTQTHTCTHTHQKL